MPPTTMSSSGVSKTSSRRAKAAPKLKESCDCCAQAKVRCTRERPSCLRCRTKGNNCQYSYSRRAGRKTMSSTTASTTPSDSDCSSYHGSPQALPTQPSFAHMERTMSTSSFASSASSSLDEIHGLPIPEYVTPQLPLQDQCHEEESLDMWSHPPFVTTADDLNNDWYRLTDSFPETSTTHFTSHFETNPTSSPAQSTTSDTDSLLEHLELESTSFPMFDDVPRSAQLGGQQQESFLFAETEAIREELRLLGNFVGTLEERVDRSVRCAGLQQKAAMEAKALCGDFTGETGACAAGSLVTRFDASDLRRRLGGIRHEIECIVGFG